MVGNMGTLCNARTFVERGVGLAQALDLLGVPGLLNGCLWYKGRG